MVGAIPKHLLFLLLALAPHDGVQGPSCRDLRDAELILAEHEVQLLDELASESARTDERETWKGELDDTKSSLEDVDRALADARCPAPSQGG